MPETAKTLRDRVTLFRRLLAEAVDADLTRDYLNEIGMAEWQLRELESPDKKKP